MLAPPNVNVRDELLRSLPALKRFAIKLTGSTDKAQDLVNDTAVRVLEKERDYTPLPGINIEAWFCVIMRNLWYSQARNFWRTVEDVDEVFASKLMAADDPFWTVELKRVLNLMMLMPPGYVSIILGLIEGKSYQEIADNEFVPEGTVKSRANRARQFLRIDT